jgi:hypothetical protein
MALSVGGGVFELAGLMIVAVGIARDRAHAGRFFVARARKPRRERRYPPHEVPQSPRPSPTLGQSAQLQRILTYIAQVDTPAYNNFINMQRAFDIDLADTTNLLRDEMAEADDVLRGPPTRRPRREHPRAGVWRLPTLPRNRARDCRVGSCSALLLGTTERAPSRGPRRSPHGLSRFISAAAQAPPESRVRSSRTDLQKARPSSVQVASTK